MTGSAEVARDITHTCFASLLETPSRFDGRACLGTYLCAAARDQSRGDGGAGAVGATSG